MTAIVQFSGFVKSEPLEHIARNTRREYVRFTARERDRGQARTWVVFALRHDTIQAARDLRVGDAVSISGSPRLSTTNAHDKFDRLVVRTALRLDQLRPEQMEPVEALASYMFATPDHPVAPTDEARELFESVRNINLTREKELLWSS